MKKLFLIGCFLAAILFIARMMDAPRPPAQAQQALIANTEYLSLTPQPTFTAIPSATIGYEETLQVAQATADEARRVNAEVTAQFEQRIQEQLQMTAQADQRNQEIYSWTAIAANTIIPLTATQQAINNTQVPKQQEIISAQLTSTYEAPTQMMLIADAVNRAKYGRIETLIRLFVLFSIGIFATGIGIFLARYPVPEKKEEQPESKSETIVFTRQDHGQGTFTQQRTVVPCSPEQLTELAVEITGGRKTLAINQWEGSGTSFTRPIIHAVRGWMQINKYAVSTGDGQLAPTPLGLDFLNGWLESQQLPTEYEFVETEEVTE